LSRLVIRSVASAVFRERSILPYPSPASLSNSPDSFPFLPSRQTLSSRPKSLACCGSQWRDRGNITMLRGTRLLLNFQLSTFNSELAPALPLCSPCPLWRIFLHYLFTSYFLLPYFASFALSIAPPSPHVIISTPERFPRSGTPVQLRPGGDSVGRSPKAQRGFS
jgi:hypothetical protein